MKSLDLEFVRAAFPALSAPTGRDGEERPWVLMDNAGGSVPCIDAIEGIHDYLRGFGVQLGASYPRSVAAQALVTTGLADAARLFTTTPDQMVIGPSTTMNVYVLARAVGELLEPGDEIVVSELDHEANIGAWRRLTERGIVVREWPMHSESALLRLEDLEPLLGPATRLVCFTHCPNVVGNIHDVRSIADRVHAAGGLVCIDGVAFAPHRRIDVDAFGADIYLASLYKVYGPHVGAAFVRRELLERLPNQNHFFIGSDAGPYRLEPGNVNHELTAGISGIVRYLERVAAHHGVDEQEDQISAAFELFAAHETALATPVLAYLREHRRTRLLGEPSPQPGLRAPTIAFTVADAKASEIPAAMDAHGVAIRWGHFYAHRAIERMGLLSDDGVVRISMVHYNTMAEVDRLLAALDQVL